MKSKQAKLKLEWKNLHRNVEGGESIQHLYENGLVLPGSWVQTDLLVGKDTPKGELDQTSENSNELFSYKYNQIFNLVH